MAESGTNIHAVILYDLVELTSWGIFLVQALVCLLWCSPLTYTSVAFDAVFISLRCSDLKTYLPISQFGTAQRCLLVAR